MTALQTDTPTDRLLRHSLADLFTVANHCHDNRCFFFSSVFVFKGLDGVANTLLHILQLVRQSLHVFTNLLVRDFCVNLGSLYVGVTEKPADGFNRYTVG